MNKFILSFLFLGSLAQAADICTEPAAAICEPDTSNPLPLTMRDIFSEASVAQQIGTMKGLVSIEGSDEEKAFKTLANNYSSVYQVTIQHLADKRITEVDIAKKLSDIRKAVMDNLKSGLMGPSLEERGPLSNGDLADRVKEVRFVDIRSLPAKASSSKKLLQGMIQNCGPDGSGPGAFYEPVEKLVVVCPGFLLAAFNANSLDILNLGVAHELSHSVDATTNAGRDILDNKMSLYPKYIPFLDCMENNYGRDMAGYEEAVAQMQGPGSDYVRGKISELKAQERDNRIAIMQHELLLNQLRGLVGQLGGIKREYTEFLGRPPTTTDYHADELSADHGGSLALVSLLKSVPKEKRVSSLKLAAGNMLCTGTNELYTQLLGPKQDEGIHTGSELRMRLLMNNPEIRTLLGCQTPTGSGPWCRMDGMSDLTVRCSPSAVKTCESDFKKELEGSGCSLKRVSCNTTGGVKTCSALSQNCEVPNGSCTNSTQVTTNLNPKLCLFNGAKPNPSQMIKARQ